MPASMTGMGKASGRCPKFHFEVETRSVNNRYLVIKNRLPDILSQYDQRLQEVLRRRIRRGTVDLIVRLKWAGAGPLGRINREMLEGYLREVKRLRKRERLGGDLIPERLLGLPGVVQFEEEETITAKEFALIEEAARSAVERLMRMRIAEGRRLIRGISKRRRLMERCLTVLERKARQGVGDRMKRLKSRVSEILNGDKLPADDPALQREIAILADRSDITEETDRFKSHLVQFDVIIASDGEMGRQLDFLLQEMGREINTIGSKACNASVSHEVVKIKAELEKIREQVQNIE